mgnify:CR=1 FL=1
MQVAGLVMFLFALSANPAESAGLVRSGPSDQMTVGAYVKGCAVVGNAWGETSETLCSGALVSKGQVRQCTTSSDYVCADQPTMARPAGLTQAKDGTVPIFYF